MSNLSEPNRSLFTQGSEIDSRQGQPARRQPDTDPIAKGKSDRACHEERSTEQPTQGSDTSNSLPNPKGATSAEIPKTDDPDLFIPRRLYPIGRPYAPAIHRDEFPNPAPVGDPALLVPLTSDERGRLLVKYPPPAATNLEPTLKMENEGEEAGGESAYQRTFGFNPANVHGLVFGWRFHVEWYNEQIQKEMEETRRMQALLAKLRTRLAVQEGMLQKRHPVSLEDIMQTAKRRVEANIKDLEAILDVRWKEAQKFFVDYSDGTKPHVPSPKPPAAETDEAKNRIIPPIEDNPIAYINSRARHRTCQRRDQPYEPNRTEYNPVPPSARSTSTRYQEPAARTRQSATPSTHREQRSGPLSLLKRTPQGAAVGTSRDPPKGVPQANPGGPKPTNGGPVHQGRLSETFRELATGAQEPPAPKSPQPPASRAPEPPAAPAPKSPAQPSNQAPAPTNQEPTAGIPVKNFPNVIVPGWFPSLDARGIIPLQSKSTKAKYIEFYRKTEYLFNQIQREEEEEEEAKKSLVEQNTATDPKTADSKTADSKTAEPNPNPVEGSHKPQFPHQGTLREKYSFIVAAVEEAKAMLAESHDALSQ